MEYSRQLVMACRGTRGAFGDSIGEATIDDEKKQARRMRGPRAFENSEDCMFTRVKVVEEKYEDERQC